LRSIVGYIRQQPLELLMRTSFLTIWLGSGCAFITDDEFAHRMSSTQAPECAFTTVYYADADGDTFGNPDVFMEACTAPEGTVGNAEDCDDSDDSAYPGAKRPVDRDGDGYGHAEDTVESCLIGEGMSANSDDCDDDDPLVNPSMEENCATESDDDCSSSTNDEGAIGCTAWFPDEDGDGFAGGEALCLCEPTDTHTDNVADDCEDTDPEIHPDAVEVCNDGIDNNCDEEAIGCGFSGELSASNAAYTITGVADVGMAGSDLFYGPDVDGDGQDDLLIGAYGDSALTIVSGMEPGSYQTDDFVRLTGIANHRLTRDIVVPGDLDGDDVPDLILGAPGADPSGGASGLVNIYFGPFGETTDLMAPDVQLVGPHGNANFGRDLGHVGDFNGDGFVDVFAGGLNIKHPESSKKLGAVYMVYGPLEQGEVFEVGELGSVDLAIYGEDDDDKFGVSLTAMEDWSGDGLPDLLIGARLNDLDQGSVYGFESGKLLDGGGGLWPAEDYDVKLRGVGNRAMTGEALKVIDDVTGDGKPDLLVGAPERNLEGDKFGAAYLVSAPLVTADIDSIAVAEFRGASDTSGFGSALAGTNVLDEDDTLGIAIGAPGHDNRGAVHLYAAPFEGSITTDMAWGTVTGVAEDDGLGAALIGGVDYDRDGMFDLIVGAALPDGGKGQVLILLGGDL